ncbi:MAG TPA: magnesium-translocating P-type ATPase [Lacisediminihabitans sp.]|uniref:magnesium-translocating P-type ATPase n=1 Tax=Lacisediminihabitans sp. TaxID=2787631 RepID=UPI002EDA6117
MSTTIPTAFWNTDRAALLADLDSTGDGLTSDRAAAVLARVGRNTLGVSKQTSAARLLARQFLSPIIIILVIATVLAWVLGDPVDSVIILVIILLSGLLGFFQERSAGKAIAALLATVEITATILRDGKSQAIPLTQVVPGDVAQLSAGDLVPGDSIVLDSNGLQLDESALTGETFPVEKRPGTSAADAELNARPNMVFMGTHVASGSGTVLVVGTGVSTEIGSVSSRLQTEPPKTGFEKGMTSFGLLLTRIMLVLVVVIFLINLLLHRAVIDSVLFSLALAVGLTPQLLPTIVSISLAQGARAIAKRRVIVRRLDSIEDFGSMSIFCSDKTGTMTAGQVVLDAALDVAGAPSDSVARLAFIDAFSQIGLKNPIDDAICAGVKCDVSKVVKLGELPYDFNRRRLSILFADAGGAPTLVSKGALDAILAVCTSARASDGSTVPIAAVNDTVQKLFLDLSNEGFRVLGVATRELPGATSTTLADEAAMTLVGFVTFADPAKPDAAKTLEDLAANGVSVRMLTGDNRLVAAHIAKAVGLDTTTVLTGTDIDRLDDTALAARAPGVVVFAELNPIQKERIVRALRTTGETVGYMGDGINDSLALRAADVGISVDSAVAVAKEAAAIVLLDKDLNVLLAGMTQGRRTFANTMKYIFMTTSASFGNVLSMAIAAAVLPFLPLLASQILLINLLTDFPATFIATDSVDAAQLRRPQHWDVRLIQRYMLVFGALSSVFDLVTFAVLEWGFHAQVREFQSAWFLGSILTEITVLFVLRTRRPFFRSRPSRWIVMASVLVAAVAFVIPYSPVAAPLNLVAIPLPLLVAVLAITLMYLVANELVKRVFWRPDQRTA